MSFAENIFFRVIGNVLNISTMYPGFTIKCKKIFESDESTWSTCRHGDLIQSGSYQFYSTDGQRKSKVVDVRVY